MDKWREKGEEEETAGSNRRFGVTGNSSRKRRRDRRLVLGATLA